METLKKVIICIMVAFGFIACSWVESHYTRKDCIIIKTYDNYAIAKDGNGYNWTFVITDNDVQVGNTVNLRMFNSFTDYNIHDDIVESYQKKEG